MSPLGLIGLLAPPTFALVTFLLTNYFARRKTSASVAQLSVDTAENAVSLVRAELKEYAEELKDTRYDLREARREVHLLRLDVIALKEMIRGLGGDPDKIADRPLW